MIQSGLMDMEHSDEEIPRLRKEDMKDIQYKDVDISNYVGPKKPSMPFENATQNVLPDEIKEMGESSARIAESKDFEFFKSICEIPDTPEYSGFNIFLARDSGQCQQHETTRMYTL